MSPTASLLLRRLLLAFVSAVFLGLLLVGCGGGGSGRRTDILGTWSGQLTRTGTRSHGGLYHILTIQFLPGAGENSFSGTARFSLPFGDTEIPLGDGIISGTLDPVTNRVRMTLTFFVDENGDPSSTGQTQTWTGDLSVLQSNMTGTYAAPGETGTVSLNRQTTPDHPNVNVTGHWTGDPAGGQGFQLVNPVKGEAVGARGAMSIDYQQTSDNRVTATITAPNPNGQPFTVTAGGSVTGNLVLVTGKLPANAGSITLAPGVPPISLAGRSFSYDALVSQQSGKTIQSGRLRVRFQDLLNDPIVNLILLVGEIKLEDRAGYLDIGTFDVTLNTSTTGGVNLPVR